MIDTKIIENALAVQKQALHFCRKQKVQTDVVKEKIKYYECLEAALEKQIPKKPKDGNVSALCPICTKVLSGDEYYCPRCGQKVEWGK